MRYLLISVALTAVGLGGGVSAKPVEKGAGDPVPVEDYRIGIEDALRIVVWDEPNLNLTLKVRPDGQITVPLINDVTVAGMTPEQVRRELTTRLSEFIREPSVTVIVEQINSYRIYVLGEVNAQGVLNFSMPARLLEALASVGGLTHYASKKITIIRQAGGAEQRIEVDYKRLITGADENLVLKPGDIVLAH